MIQRSIKRLSLRALVVDDELGDPTAEGRAIRGARAGLARPRYRGRRGDFGGGRHVRDHLGLRDPRRADRLDARRRPLHDGSRAFIESVRSRNDKIPIFLMAERGEASAIPVEVMGMVDEFIWTLEDTAAFVGGRVVGGDPPLPRGDAAAAGRGADEVHAGLRVFMAHAGPRGRNGVPEVARRARVLRLLRRESAALGSVDQRRQSRLAARSHGADGRAREVCGARIRRAPHVLRHERHLDVEPRDLHGGRGPRSDRALRSQLPQVDRAQPRDDRRHPDLFRSAAQPLRHHRPDSARAARQGSDQEGDQGQPAGHEGHRDARRLLGRHELDLRRALLQRAARGGAARPERRPHPFRRGVVRVRALQSALSRSSRDARRSEGSQGADRFRDALHAQAAGRALAGFVPAHPRRPRRRFRTRASTSRS